MESLLRSTTVTTEYLNLKHFHIGEFNCQYTGDNKMSHSFLVRLDTLRSRCGFPFLITSGYRSPIHPKEAVKEVPGTHAQGIAADIRITNSKQRYLLLKEAFDMGFNGIGVADNFIHIDDRRSTQVLWTY